MKLEPIKLCKYRRPAEGQKLIEWLVKLGKISLGDWTFMPIYFPKLNPLLFKIQTSPKCKIFIIKEVTFLEMVGESIILVSSIILEWMKFVSELFQGMLQAKIVVQDHVPWTVKNRKYW